MRTRMSYGERGSSSVGVSCFLHRGCRWLPPLEAQLAAGAPAEIRSLPCLHPLQRLAGGLLSRLWAAGAAAAAASSDRPAAAGSSPACGAPQAAAAWMLECPDLAAAQAAWQAEAQARRAERERSKKAIVSRFQLQAVPDGGSAPPGKGRPPPLQAWGQAAGGGGGRGGEGSKVRYRDGMVATRAGQKYVVGKASFWVWAAHVAVGHSASSIGQPSLDLPAPACASRGFPPLSVPACLRTPPNPEPPCLPRSAGRGLGRRQPRQSVHQGQAR